MTIPEEGQVLAVIILSAIAGVLLAVVIALLIVVLR